MFVGVLEVTDNDLWMKFAAVRLVTVKLRAFTTYHSKQIQEDMCAYYIEDDEQQIGPYWVATIAIQVIP